MVLFRQRDCATDDIRLETHIGVRKQKPIAVAGFKSLLKSVRFSEPAAWNLGNVYCAKSRMRSREFIDNARGSILRAVVDGNDFQAWIIERRQSRKRRRQLFLFIPCGENQRNARASCIFSGREMLNPGKFCCAIGGPEAVEHPKSGDQRGKNESKSVHQN